MRLLRLLFLPASLVLILSAAWTVPLPLFVERPGATVSLPSAVDVELPEAAGVNGDYLLTAVSLRRSTVVSTVTALVDDEADLAPTASFIPPGVDEDTYFQQQRELFAASAELAAAVGLEAAGFAVDPEAMRGDGALILEVLPGSPAAEVLRPGDVITAVDGEPVSVAEDLRDAIRDPTTGGDVRRITFRRDDQEMTVELTPAMVPQADQPVIGVVPQTLNPRVELPVPVDIDAGRIGGPSAGLMIALTVYDLATPDEDLAAGRRIAGTGTITADGRVGRISGVALKVIAAAREGVNVFLAPTEQIEAARAALPPDSDMRVIGVATFAEARTALTGA